VILAVAVGLAAALGAVCRYALDLVIQHRHDSILPWGTFTINASGSLLLGLVTGLGLHHGLPHAATVVLLRRRVHHLVDLGLGVSRDG
jgi:CrcB protein